METAISPGQVCELGIYRASDHLRVDGLKLVQTITECNDLSRTDKCAAEKTKQMLLLENNAVQQSQMNVQSDNVTCIRWYLQVQGIEEKNEVFAFVVRQLQLLEFTVDDSCSFPVGCRL